jgi:hypothetical protein
MHPEVEQFLMTIFYIQFNCPFTIPFGKHDLALTEEMLQERFEDIKNNKCPNLIRRKKDRWKCSRICHFGKTLHPSGDINPITGECHTLCSYIHNEVMCEGLENTVRQERVEGFDIGEYHAPGTGS